MCLDRLDRDEQRGCHLAVAEAPRDQPHHLLLARREPVELVVGHRDVPGAGPEGIEHEPGDAVFSPPATCLIASPSSGPVIAFVTYPRAPARRTYTTASAASDTDRARKRGSPSRSAQAAITSAPPPPPPPGRCTSRSTTLGRSSRTARPAPSTSSASPTTSKASSSDARTPARNIRWSSTSTTVIASSSISADLPARRGQCEVHLGAAVARILHRCRAAAPPDPADDRLANAEPIGRNRVQVETRAVVAHEDLNRFGSDLDVQRDRRGTVPHRVEKRLPGCLEHRVRVRVGCPVPHHDGLDRLSGRVLDLADDAADRLRDRGAGSRAVLVQPAAQLSLLGAREACDRFRICL